MAQKKTNKSDRYLVKIGLHYPPNCRAEKGDIVDDLPDFAIKGLLENGVIEHLDDGTPKSLEGDG